MLREFNDRIPSQGKTNRKKITYSDNSEEYVIIENADDPISGNEGTPLNRFNMMAAQGFQNNNIEMQQSGNVTTITETMGSGEILTTTITDNNDGSTQIQEILIGKNTITKTTTINSLGTIIEEVLS